MKLVLQLVIKLYWKMIPEEKRRVCLYKESCSKHIYQLLEDKDLKIALKALKFRFFTCNSDYIIKKKDNGITIITKGYLISEENCNPLLIDFLKT